MFTLIIMPQFEGTTKETIKALISCIGLDIFFFAVTGALPHIIKWITTTI